MDSSTTIQAIEMVRRIRDRQAEELAGKSDAEVIAFFRRAGEEARKAAACVLPGRAGKGQR
jgi:hypothetical protein